jgi:hypothetical protein
MGVSVPFTNPIVAGNSLIREAIQSPNFVSGSSGWSINKDGSAEFTDALIRGEFSAGNGAVTVNSSGLYVTGASAEYKTDINGGFNARLIPDDGSFARMQTAILLLRPPNPSPINGITPISSGFVFAEYQNAGSIEYPFMWLKSPSFTGKAAVSLSLIGQSSASSTDDTNTYLETNSFRWSQAGVPNKDLGRGYIASERRTSTSGPVGPGEAVAWTFASRTYKANRVYEIRGNLTLASSVSGATVFPRIRKTNAAGQLLNEYARFVCTTSGTQYGHPTTIQVFAVGSNDVTASLCITLQNSSGTATIFGDPSPAGSLLRIYDVGLASSEQLIDDPNMAVLV